MNRANRSYATPDDGSEDEVEYDDPWPTRLPSSSRRYDRVPTASSSRPVVTMHPNRQVPRAAIPARRSAMQPTGGWRQTEESTAPAPARRRSLFRAHPVLWLGVGMLFMLLLWVSLQDLGAWWNLHQQDVTYGRPRTAQYDVVVGHDDSPAHPSHFIALNLGGTIEIIELPGGDVTHAHIYQGPHLYDPGSGLFPVTLTFPVPAGQSLPDMEVHVQGQIIVYLNRNGQFVPQVSSQ